MSFPLNPLSWNNKETLTWGFPSGSALKESACNAGNRLQHRRPGFWKTPCRRKRQPTPVFMPRKFHGLRSLVGYIQSLPACLDYLTLCDPLELARQARLSMGFSRKEYWSELPFPSPRDIPDLGIEPVYPVPPALQADSLPTESSRKLSPQGHKSQIQLSD